MKANTPKPANSRFKKNLLKKQLAKESKLVSKDSMNILLEFELLAGEQSGFIKKLDRKKFMESLHSKHVKKRP